MSIQRHHPTTAPVARPLTYCETQNAQPFNWWEFLDLAEAGKIVREGPEHIAACQLAINWTTCACGAQCFVIPRWTQADSDAGYPCNPGQPKDKFLSDRGGTFFAEISLGQWRSARTTLRAIEARSAQLIAELSQP